MGIPFYFKSIVRKFPEIIQPYNPKTTTTTRLFLDFNSIIHTCARQTIESWDNPSDTRLIEDKIIANIIDFVNTLVAHVSPTTLVYVAVDGICPRAKMNQQRKRRFMTAWRNTIVDHFRQTNGMKYTTWDSNAITPGTKFMNNLDVALHNFAKTNHMWKVSGSNEKGEGEHKIFDYINNNPTQGTDTIYGLDADLILLSLLNSNKGHTIRLLRERPAFDIGVRVAAEYLTLDINSLGNSLVQTYSLANSTHEQTIKDYVMACSLLGNDFLPPLSHLKIKEDGIDIIMNTYKSCLEETGQPLVAGTTINNVALYNIIGKLAANENAQMKDVWEIWMGRQFRVDKRKTNKLDIIQSELDNYPTIHKYPASKINPTVPGWHDDYYEHLFHPCNDVAEICDSYIHGLHWVARYYMDYSSASHSWYYKHNYSPLINDLHSRLRNVIYNVSGSGTIDDITTKTDETFASMYATPALQLLMVLPPQSISLLPQRLQPLMQSVTHRCLHYYPKGFNISTFLKGYLWECSPQLPDIDIDTIINQSARCL